MIEAEFRPIDTWPGPKTSPRLGTGRFKATYPATLQLLEREIAQLNGRRIVIETGHKSTDIRQDGWPRANATDPQFPGVIVSFESKHGPLRYFTDAFYQEWSGDLPGWQGNLRAIALGLEALRKVDRYGIGKRGEQYTGWSALPPGTVAAGPASMTVDEAWEFLREHSPHVPWARTTGAATAMYRDAAKRLHPDAGGSTELFQRLEEAKRVLDQGARL